MTYWGVLCIGDYLEIVDILEQEEEGHTFEWKTHYVLNCIKKVMSMRFCCCCLSDT